MDILIFGHLFYNSKHMQSAVKESQIRSINKLKFSKGRLKSGKKIFFM